MFPIKTRSERRYLKKLASDIDTYCINENISSVYDLYQNFGTPQEVIYNYISALDTEFIVKRLSVSKFIKTTVAIILLLATISAAGYGFYIIRDRKVWDNLANPPVIKKTIYYSDNPNYKNPN